jgi:hypothetical protein
MYVCIWIIINLIKSVVLLLGVIAASNAEECQHILFPGQWANHSQLATFHLSGLRIVGAVDPATAW